MQDEIKVLVAQLREDVFYGEERLHKLSKHNHLHMQAADTLERLAQENEALNRDLAVVEKMAMEANDSYSDQHDALVVAEARVAKLEAVRGVGLPTPSNPCADSQSYRATTNPAEAIARAALERAAGLVWNMSERDDLRDAIRALTDDTAALAEILKGAGE